MGTYIIKVSSLTPSLYCIQYSILQVMEVDVASQISNKLTKGQFWKPGPSPSVSLFQRQAVAYIRCCILFVSRLASNWHESLFRGKRNLSVHPVALPHLQKLEVNLKEPLSSPFVKPMTRIESALPAILGGSCTLRSAKRWCDACAKPRSYS